MNQYNNFFEPGTPFLLHLELKLRGAHFKKGGIFLALKGLHIPAQGNALCDTLQ